MNINVDHFNRRPDLGFAEYAIETPDKTVKSSSNWQKAIIIIAIAAIVTGIVCLVLASTIIAPATVIQALTIIGSQCIEIGGMALIINGVFQIVKRIHRKDKTTEGRSDLLKHHKIENQKELIDNAKERSCEQTKSPEPGSDRFSGD